MSVFDAFQPIAAIGTTPAAIDCLKRLGPEVTLWLPEASLSREAGNDAAKFAYETYSDSLKEHLTRQWSHYRSFVFCLATGATVRLIAPLLKDKATDPAVVVISEDGKFVISLSGGHQGGADELARLVALRLGATPVLTGAANRAALPGVDRLGTSFGWRKGTGDWTGVSAAIARQAPVEVIQEAGSTLWQAHLPESHPFQFGFPDPASTDEPRLTAAARIWISPIQRQFAPGAEFARVQWHPRVLWVGIGCERGTPRELIEQAVRQVFQANHLAVDAIAGVATIDLKADEVGLVELCRDWQIPLRCFSSEQLKDIPVPTPSAIVAAEVGTPSVAEAAAILAATHPPIAASSSESLRVKKQIFRAADSAGAVTIAVAQSEQESTGRSGKLWLVGTGPGKLEQMTPAAQTAIAAADVVIGYSLYVDLIQPLLRPGQIVETLPITQERQRAERAIGLAEWGLTVAVVSSGDCGIYGMAGLVLEQLCRQGWDGRTPEVQVFPGITALQAAASRVGAPLMHDFCAISLSDLLTPWTVIEKRLTAAAAADFVVALYNPKSKTRTEQIAIAQQIFLQHRAPTTPVALVRSAYRDEEAVQVTTLEKLTDSTIDMLTTVLIGNESSRTHAGWIVTPRGYLGFGEESPLE